MCFILWLAAKRSEALSVSLSVRLPVTLVSRSRLNGSRYRNMMLHLETDRNSVSVSVTAPKLAIFLVLVTAVIAKHSFGLLSVTAEIRQSFGENRNCPC